RPGHRNELSSRQNNVNLSELDGKIEYGVSPRAVINLALAAKGAALMAGRAYVVPQDVKDIAPDVLRHRLTLSYEAEAENMDADSIIKILLDQLKTP
ncbi:MAG: ATPase, partial [Lentisphaeria bacterium]|nr:ATPase [Lentisphaeria bacterium]